MTQRQYRIRGARYLLSDKLLAVEYRSGKDVYLSFGEDGSPQYYLGAGPVTLEIDDGTGAQPQLQGSAPPADDDFGSVLTTLKFRGNVTAAVEEDFLVVTAAGTPKIADGADLLPVTENDLSAVDRLTWASLNTDPGPHPPVG